MSGLKRNPDKLNTIGIVVVGICGAVLVYVTIVALQAFYMNDTSELQTIADYGGQDATAKGKRADEVRNITEYASNPGGVGTYRIDIDHAMKLVVEDAKKDPSHVTGSALPPATKGTIPATFGRPQVGAAAGADAPPADADPAAAGSAAEPAPDATAQPPGAPAATPPAAAPAAPAPAAPAPAAPAPAAPANPPGAQSP